MKFVNLYLQTEYSMLQSTCKIASTVELVENYNYDSIAITDEGNMHGVIKFYNACKEKNIHPIIGLKITYSHNETKHNLLLYASNKTGYVNLMKISSRSKILDGIFLSTPCQGSSPDEFLLQYAANVNFSGL